MLLRRLLLLALAARTECLSGPSAAKSKKVGQGRKTPELFNDDIVKKHDDDVKKKMAIISDEKMSLAMKKPEVMAPAGGWPQMRAAVANGADAVYFGLSSFSARARAANFDDGKELDEVMTYLRDNEVLGFVALNTLGFDDELEEVERLIRRCAEAGVNALIVQDVGLMALAREVAPNLALHASTQQSISSAEGAEYARRLGANRVVVGRELSVTEIEAVVKGTDAEVECFVHGALCVSWSGQCFSSEAWGGRSANRGQCAQGCRKPYDLLVDGKQQGKTSIDPYILSPQDLCGLDEVPELMDAGVACFKIEGRLKDERYVAATTRSYREAVDNAWAKKHGGDETELSVERGELAQVFSRGQDADHAGLSPGFLTGANHQTLVRGRAPRHRGVLAGKVLEVRDGQHGGVELKVESLLGMKRGDGVVIDLLGEAAGDNEFGGAVYDVTTNGEETILAFANSLRAPAGLSESVKEHGALLWRTSDGAVDAKLKSLARQPALRRTFVTGKCDLVYDNEAPMLELSLSDAEGRRAFQRMKLQPATSKPLDEATLQKAAGTLGDSPWKLENGGKFEIDEKLFKGLWCRAASVKELRRALVQEFRLLRTPIEHSVTVDERASTMTKPKPTQGISVLVRDLAQCKAVLNWRSSQFESEYEVDEVIVDFLEIVGVEEAVQLLRGEVKVVLAAPRILLDGEAPVLDCLVALKPDALLLRSAGQMEALRDCGVELRGDFSLNAANTLSAKQYLRDLTRLTPSHDLSGPAQAELAVAMGEEAGRLELVAHQHLPIFHSSHCVFARHLSNGKDYTDCGHPCEKHTLHLRDEAGMDHPVLADMGCRNTVFNAQAQSAAPFLGAWLDAGVRRFRIEFVDDAPETVCKVLDAYANLFSLEGKAPEPLWSLLKHIPDRHGKPQGVSQGSLRANKELTAGSLLSK